MEEGFHIEFEKTQLSFGTDATVIAMVTSVA